MKLPGIVTNVTAFGAFVDIGVHQDGLVHISQLADRFVRDPAEVVKVRQRVKVTRAGRGPAAQADRAVDEESGWAARQETSPIAADIDVSWRVFRENGDYCALRARNCVPQVRINRLL